MAKIQQVVYTDDLTGEPIESEDQVHFEPIMVDGMVYELTLSADSKKAFDEALAPFLAGADAYRAPKDMRARSAKAGQANRRATKATNPAKTDKEQNEAMRVWWGGSWRDAELPEPKSARGRIPASVQDAYHKHNGMKVGNGTDEIRAASKAASKNTEAPVSVTTADVPYPQGDGGGVEAKYSTSGSAAAKKATPKAATNGKVSEEEFLAVYRQTGGDRRAIEDALPSLTKGAIYARTAAARKKGLIPAV